MARLAIKVRIDKQIEASNEAHQYCEQLPCCGGGGGGGGVGGRKANGLDS